MRELEGSRPTQVARAVWLLWAALILAIVGAVPMYLEPLPSDTLATKWSLWAILAFVWGFWALLTFSIGRRQNWARVTTLLFFIGGLIYCVLEPQTLTARPAYELALQLADTTMTGIALYWLFTGSGAAWFRRIQRESNAL